MSYGTFTLTGHHTTPSGKPHAGSVVITPNTIIRDTAGDIVLSGAEQVKLDDEGAWSIILPCDSAGLNPASGIGYTIGYALRSTSMAQQSFYATADLAGSTLDESDIVTVSVPAPLSAIVGPAGPSTPEATADTAGKVRLAGDLAGTADAPTVPGLESKVETTDPRLSDARTPLTHSHPTSQVTGLDSALSGKVDIGDARLTDARPPLAHTHTASGITDFDAATDARIAGGNSPAARKADLPFNVKIYGAKGDGATDDTTAILACYTAARAAFGTVSFPPGTYIVSNRIPVNGTVTNGYGATLKIKDATTPNYAGVMNSSSGAAVIAGLTFDLNKANTTDPGSDTTGMAIYFNPASGWTGRSIVRDVRVINGHRSGIRAQTTAAGPSASTNAAAELTIDNSVVTGCGKSGIYVQGLTDVRITDCKATSNGLGGIYEYLCLRSVIARNTANANTGHGITSLYGLHTSISQNAAISNTDGGVCMGGGSTTLTVGMRYSVMGNVCASNGSSGVILDPTVSGSGAYTTQSVFGTVTGNTCTGNTVHGVFINNASQVSVSGNVCVSNGNAGVSIATSRTSISGNSCTGNLTGISLFGAATSAYVGHRVGVNDVAGNTTSGYFVQGVGVSDIQFATISSTPPAA